MQFVKYSVVMLGMTWSLLTKYATCAPGSWSPIAMVVFVKHVTFA